MGEAHAQGLLLITPGDKGAATEAALCTFSSCAPSRKGSHCPFCPHQAESTSRAGWGCSSASPEPAHGLAQSRFSECLLTDCAHLCTPCLSSGRPAVTGAPPPPFPVIFLQACLIPSVGLSPPALPLPGPWALQTILFHRPVLASQESAADPTVHPRLTPPPQTPNRSLPLLSSFLTNAGWLSQDTQRCPRSRGEESP